MLCVEMHEAIKCSQCCRALCSCRCSSLKKKWFPYMPIYSGVHIIQCFSHSLDVFTPKIRRNVFDVNIFKESKQMLLAQEGYGKFSLRLIGSASFCATLIWLHVSECLIFGTLKDDSLWFNVLASNNCFSHRNVFQNGVNTLSKIVNHFCQNAQTFARFGAYDFVQIIFAVNLPLKLHATVANADDGSLKSLHIFLRKCLHHMLVKFDQNRIWSKLHEILSFLTKNRVFYNHFWQRVDAILEDVYVAKIFV